MSELLIQFFASFYLWVLFAGVLLIWIFDKKTTLNFILQVLASALVAWVIAEMIKNLFPTIRPFYLNNSSPLTLTVPTDPSYPSAHTAVAFASAIAVWIHKPKTGIFYIISAIVIGLARILASVHIFIDIFGGTLVGVSTGLIIARINLERLFTRSKNSR